MLVGNLILMHFFKFLAAQLVIISIISLWIGLGTPLTPTNREVRSVERPFLFKIILFQLYHNDFIYTFLVRLIPTI